jgi:hypothetical protein
LILDFFALR